MKPAGEVWSAPARAPRGRVGASCALAAMFAAVGGATELPESQTPADEKITGGSDDRRQTESLHPPEAYGQYARQCRQRSDLCIKLKGRYSKAQIQGGVSGRDPEWAGRHLSRDARKA